MTDFVLDVYRCHPKASKIIAAEKTLNGTANAGGVQWCRPYSSANRTGFWVFSPVDIDITWLGGNSFQHQFLEEYGNEDHDLIQKTLKTKSQISNLDKWCPAGGRTKFTWGAVEHAVVQMWTGLVFKTPPGWILQIRSPINLSPREFHIMEGILETDWMQYEIWFNIVFDIPNKPIQFRKTWPPIAQLVPMRRESVDGEWAIKESSIYDNKEVFDYWVNYNTKKFCRGGNQPLSTTDPNLKKDSTTYHRERKRILGKEMEPKALNKKYRFFKD